MNLKKQFKINHFFRIISIIILISFVSGYGQDDEYEIYQEIKELRTLGGHYFTPSNTIKSPFILTHVRMSLGVGGISDIRYPLFELGGEQYVFLQGDIFAAILAFEYQHAVKEWLAVYLKFGLIGRLGSDIGTLLQQGVNYATTFDIGWMIKIYRKKKFALSTTFGLTNGNYSLISLQNFVNDIISSMPNSSLIKSNNFLFGTVGVKAAYGFNEFIGVHVLADFGYGETVQRQLENKIFTTLGFNTDLNFRNIIKTPISLSLGYLYSTYPQNNNEVFFNHNEFLFQLNYIGRTNFILSLDLSASKELGGTNENKLWLRTSMFSMRYLF